MQHVGMASPDRMAMQRYDSMNIESANGSVDSSDKFFEFITRHEDKLQMYEILSHLLKDNHPILNEKFGWAIKENSTLNIPEIQKKYREDGPINFLNFNKVEPKSDEVIKGILSNHPRFGFAFGFYENLYGICELVESDASYMEIYCREKETNIIVEFLETGPVKSKRAFGRITIYNNINIVINDNGNDNIENNYNAFKETFENDDTNIHNYVTSYSDKNPKFVYKDISFMLSTNTKDDKNKIVRKLKVLHEKRKKRLSHSDMIKEVTKPDGLRNFLNLPDTDAPAPPAPAPPAAAKPAALTQNKVKNQKGKK